MLKKSDRLTAEEIEKLSQGKSVFGTLLSLRFAAAGRTKFAVTPSKKLFKTAVERNRVRRRIYGALDSLGAQRADGSRPSFVMIMPKRECLGVPSDELKAEILSLLARTRRVL